MANFDDLVNASTDYARCILAVAARRGDADVVSALRSGWDLTTDFAREDNCLILRIAAANGHVKVMRVLREEWGMTSRDARAKGNEALLDAAKRDDVAVLRELREGWELTIADVLSRNYEILIEAVKSNSLGAIREFRIGWGLCARILSNDDAFCQSIRTGTIPVFREFCEGWGYDPKKFLIAIRNMIMLRTRPLGEIVEMLDYFHRTDIVTVEHLRGDILKFLIARVLENSADSHRLFDELIRLGLETDLRGFR